jgi:hypothetical protein
MDKLADRPTRHSRRDLLFSRVLKPGTTIRLAYESDWPEIERLVRALFARYGRPYKKRSMEIVTWFVAERNGRIDAVASVATHPDGVGGKVRYIHDFARDETRFMSSVAAIILARHLITCAHLEGIILLASVDRRNTEFAEMLEATGEGVPLATLYRISTGHRHG